MGPSVDGGAAERSRTFLTLAEAKRELAKAVAGRNPNGSMTLEQWHEKYWPAIASSIRPATGRSYGVAWRLRVKPSLGRHRLEDITSPMIESAMVGWSGGASAKNGALAVLSRLLDGARRSRFIDYNPAREVKRPSMRDSISPVSRALTLEQIQTLLNLFPEGAYRGYLAALVYTGMRAGEATALRVGDVDFERGIIRVSRSLSPGQRGELIEQSPKSHKSRDVPLIDALRPYAETAARGKQGSDLLFAGPDGGRLTNHNARRGADWETLREAIGRPDLRIHDLRHTFATILFDAGASAPDVQATLGHSSLQVTERYSQAREGVALRAGAALNDALKSTAGEPPKRTRRRAPADLNGTLMAQARERPGGIAR
ncbi:tyrosine-type recombinase/integrase [Leifsonia poae]|uniref:Integrase n=1 Tax=Leifsonia poae TaxID=110933 RepID=A0A9W6H8R3_9MICO|nr:site-specific integrase [Leifsonia poae]GLJ75353.1 integrase [Leifsonia poae]